MTSQHTPTRLRRASAVLAIGVLAFGAAACGDDSKDSASTSGAGTEAIASAVPTRDVVVEAQWARTSPADAKNGAAYFTITSADADKLVGVSVDASVAEMAQIHETVMKGSDTTMAGAMGSDTTAGAMGSATTMAGEMTMQPVDFVELPAGTAVEFKPGGYHVMLMGLAAPLKVGSTITLTLTLEKAGEITVDTPVLDEAP